MHRQSRDVRSWRAKEHCGTLSKNNDSADGASCPSTMICGVSVWTRPPCCLCRRAIRVMLRGDYAVSVRGLPASFSEARAFGRGWSRATQGDWVDRASWSATHLDERPAGTLLFSAAVQFTMA